MIRVDERDNLPAAGIGAGELHRSVIAVGTAVAKRDAHVFGRATGKHRAQALGILNRRRAVRVCRGVLRTLRQLLLNARGNVLVAATQVQRGSAREKVDELVAVGVDYRGIFRTVNRQWKI